MSVSKRRLSDGSRLFNNGQEVSEFKRRQVVRRVAQEIGAHLKSYWSNVRTSVDIDSCEEEDAFLWISLDGTEFRDSVIITALELSNKIAARHGLWIVPRVLNEQVHPISGRINSFTDGRTSRPN